MSGSDVSIRPERPEDHPKVFRVIREAFGREAEAVLVEGLRREAPGCISLVAASGEEVVGHIFFSPVSIEKEGGSRPAMGLAPLAVLPERQDQGIGTRLVEEGLSACKRAGHRVVVVLGFPPFYSRFGFYPHRGLHYSDDVMRDSFMAVDLHPNALRGVRGTVRFHPLFEKL